MLNKLNKLRAKLSWSIGGNLVYALSQWLIITVIARFGSTEDLGIYSIGLAITAPIVLFFKFQLRTIIATDSNDEYKFSQYLGSRIVHLTIGFIIIIPIAVIYAIDNKTILVILLMGIYKSFEALSEICLGYLQKVGRVELIGKSQFYKGITIAITVSFIYILTQNLIISIITLIIVMFLRLILYDIKNVKTFTNVMPVFESTWYKLLKMAFPLGIASLITSLNTNIPRYFLDYYWGVEEVGIFSALYYVLVAGNMLITPISLLAAPRIANAFNNASIKSFVKVNFQLSAIVTLIFFVFIIVIITQGQHILTILYGKEYAIHQESFTILSLSLFFGFLTTFFSLSAVAARVLKVQPIINLLVMIITILASYYYIKSNGIIGTSYSVLISRAFQMFLSLGLLVFIIWSKKKNEK